LQEAGEETGGHPAPGPGGAVEPFAGQQGGASGDGHLAGEDQLQDLDRRAGTDRAGIGPGRRRQPPGGLAGPATGPSAGRQDRGGGQQRRRRVAPVEVDPGREADAAPNVDPRAGPAAAVSDPGPGPGPEAEGEGEGAGRRRRTPGRADQRRGEQSSPGRGTRLPPGGRRKRRRGRRRGTHSATSAPSAWTLSG